MVFKICKYTLFILGTILLLAFWNILFVLQGGIGYEGNFLLIPLKLLPIFLYSSLMTWLLLKMFDKNKKIPSRRKVSFSLGGLAIFLSLTFQYFCVSKKMAPFTFSNQMFSHLEPISETLSKENFISRTGISFLEYLTLMPIGSMDREMLSYMSNVAAEGRLAFFLKRLIEEKNIQNTCKNYLKINGDYNNCIIDFQKDIYSKLQMSTTGEIMLFAIAATGIFKVKEKISEKYGKKDLYAKLKSTNDIVESSLLTLEKSKKILLKKDEPIQYSFGYNVNANSLIGQTELQIRSKFLYIALEKSENIQKHGDKMTSQDSSKNKDKQMRSISSTELIEAERTRYEALKNRLFSFQSNGFDIDSLKLKEKEIDKDLDLKLEQYKKDSRIFNVASFFFTSLNNLKYEDFKKNKEQKESNKSLEDNLEII